MNNTLIKLQVHVPGDSVYEFKLSFPHYTVLAVSSSIKYCIENKDPLVLSLSDGNTAVIPYQVLEQALITTREIVEEVSTKHPEDSNPVDLESLEISSTRH